MNFIIVAYYTNDGVYGKYVRDLAISLSNFGVEYKIERISSLGGWQENTQYKPRFIKKMLEDNKGKSIVYVDVDSVFCRYPALFDTLNCDIAVHMLDHKLYKPSRRELEILSGTIFLSNNAAVASLVDQWIQECQNSPDVWDQRVLASIIGGDFYNLPPEYCCIADYMGRIVTNPVIKHFQASREYRKLGLTKRLKSTV